MEKTATLLPQTYQEKEGFIAARFLLSEPYGFTIVESIAYTSYITIVISPSLTNGRDKFNRTFVYFTDDKGNNLVSNEVPFQMPLRLNIDTFEESIKYIGYKPIIPQGFKILYEKV